MNIIQHLKDYFKKKEANIETGPAPVGVCPNCYGKQEWDGEYYKFMKGQNGNPSEETYNNFVQNVARKLDKITVKHNTYTCETCRVKYDKN
jgi:Zn-finger nucleic acid-binding protein